MSVDPGTMNTTTVANAITHEDRSINLNVQQMKQRSCSKALYHLESVILVARRHTAWR